MPSAQKTAIGICAVLVASTYSWSGTQLFEVCAVGMGVGVGVGIVAPLIAGVMKG